MYVCGVKLWFRNRYFKYVNMGGRGAENFPYSHTDCYAMTLFSIISVAKITHFRDF